mmetsp:Transcript_68769/g.174739  ORF Transcript_68769/g.174739 Transcript_68769/m.174739 type:complete len:203 (+) Transcript_68769:290-898(+)
MSPESAATSDSVLHKAASASALAWRTPTISADRALSSAASACFRFSLVEAPLPGDGALALALPMGAAGMFRRYTGEMGGLETAPAAGLGSLVGTGGGTEARLEPDTSKGHVWDLPNRNSNKEDMWREEMRTALSLSHNCAVACASYLSRRATNSHTETKLKRGELDSSASLNGSSVNAGYCTPSSSKMTWPLWCRCQRSCAA